MFSNEFEVVVRDTAASFRLGMEAQGSEGLVSIIDSLPSLLASVTSVTASRLNQVLSTMLDAQGRNNYLYLADLLEFELLELLIPTDLRQG